MSNPDSDSPAPVPGTDPHLVHIVTEDEAGERADVVLGRAFPRLSRRVARKLALEGALRIDGRPAKPSHRVQAGENLSLRVADASEAPSFQLEVLEIRDAYVYVHKPAGVHTVALRPGERDCLATAVVARFPECGEASEDPREGGALHRLDRATSGVVAFARSREAWEAGRQAFRDQTVTKDYLALSRQPWPPRLPDGGLSTWLDECDEAVEPLASLGDEGSCHRIRAALGPHELPSRVQVRLDGRRCTSYVTQVPSTGSLTCMRIRLETGHRHQARAHMAWVGLPLVGDVAYGDEAEAAPRLGLHALRLDLGAIDPGPAVMDDRYTAAWRRGELIPES